MPGGGCGVGGDGAPAVGSVCSGVPGRLRSSEPGVRMSWLFCGEPSVWTEQSVFQLQRLREPFRAILVPSVILE